jgi:predicted Zn finger-like uncharacterized protein
MIKFRCPNCQTKLGVPDEYAGRRVRCNKCGQPTIVPKPIAEVPVASPLPPSPAPKSPPAQIEPLRSPLPQESELLDLLNDQLTKIQEDPNAKLLRQTRRDKLAKEKIKLSPHNATQKPDNPSMCPSDSDSSSFLTDIIPDVLHFPLSLLLSVLLMAVVIGIWIVRSRAAQSPLGFFAVVVFMAAATGIRLLSVNRTFVAGVLAMILGMTGFIAGRVAIVKYVVTPSMQQQANQEILTKLPAILSDPKMQLPQNQSANSLAKNTGFMACAAIIAAVEQDDADPAIARKIAITILRKMDKSLIDIANEAGTAPRPMTDEDIEKMAKKMGEEMEKNKNNPAVMRKTVSRVTGTTNTTTTAGSDTQSPQNKETQVMEKAQTHMDKWLEDKSEGLSAARNYYPAISQLMMQTKLLRILENPKKTFIFAMIMTVGLLDMTWILIGLTSAYITASLEL